MTRRLLFWSHLCIGVVAGVAILIMSATGVFLAFERQIIAALASAGGAVLVWTGVSLALHRLRRARNSARGRQPSAASTGAASVVLVSALMAPHATAQSTQAPAGATSVQRSAFAPPTFSDDTFAYIFGTRYRNPFTASAAEPDGADITRRNIEFKHVDAWKYGHNLAVITIKSSNGVEPAAGGNAGAMGLYAILRAGLSINRIAGRPVIAIGPLKDVDLQAGVNLQTKNSAFAPNERTFYAGPNFQFRFGQAFVNVAVQVRQEWNRNGILGRVEDYDVGVNISPAWNIPFRIGGARLVFDGFADYNSAKGRDVTGHQTKAEFLARPQLKLDISRLAGQPSRVLELGVGLEYWHNMFGKNADTVPGASQLTPIVSLNIHLP
ncbi:MAG: hypothetical protein JNM38_15760 [Acidobacteria bacterium]|nr:hypothetical protein [Acidobacteriota bacterium]